MPAWDGARVACRARGVAQLRSGMPTLELKLAKALFSALLLVSAAPVVQSARGACPNVDAPCPHIVTVLADGESPQ